MLFQKKPEDIQKLINAATKYDVNYRKGLTTEQVNERIAHGLTNHTKKTVTKSYFEIIVKNVFTLLNILLFVVGGFMIYLVAHGEKLSRLFFLGVLGLNIGISLFQDIKARKLVGKLTLISSPKATVVRNGEQKIIPFNELVLSDVILVKAGDVIPSDAVILHGSVRINESLLSGEIDDVLKNKGMEIYAQSAVTSGYAYAKVTKIGNANYASQLQEKARDFYRPQSQILTSLTYIIRVISIIAIAIGIAEMISYPLLGSSFIKCIDLIGSSVVAMIPIGMYLMTSITLTVGVIILARHRVLVRELYSIEMLARVDTVCLDKTGTLTDGNMKVDQLISCSNHSKKYLEDVIGAILYITKDDNLTARALKDKFTTRVIEGEYSSIPFSSEKKYSAASFNNHTYILGAYGFIKISNKASIKKKVQYYEKLGNRVLLIAEAKGNIAQNKLPSNIKAIGILTFSENIKLDAKQNIDWFKNSDANIRIISGDSLESLKAIASRVGIEGYQIGISLEGLSDDEVKKAAHTCTIFGRVTPEQKKIIISELRNIGHTVAMIGDGVNDLLALKAADCSIAMASGSDAVKAVSHLVSLDSNFSSLPRVVEEGRKVINNLQRVCSIFLVKTLFAIFLSFLYLCLPSKHYPFTTSNLLAWEILTIGIAPFFIALEPNKERIKGGFIRNIIEEAIPGALVQVVVALSILIASYISPNAFPSDGILAVVVLAISFTSLVVLLHVCLPLNKYRGIVLAGTVFLMVMLFILDSRVTGSNSASPILDIDYSAITTSCWLLGACVVVAAIPLYFVVGYFFARLLKRRKYGKARID